MRAARLSIARLTNELGLGVGEGAPFAEVIGAPHLWAVLDAQRTGLLPARYVQCLAAATTGALAAGEYTGALRLTVAPGYILAIHRAIAYVRSTTTVGPREASLRSLTTASLRAASSSVGADARDKPEEVSAISFTGATAAITAGDPLLDSLYLTEWSGATRGTYESSRAILLDRSDHPGLASLEFVYRRTATAGDVDIAVLAVSGLAYVRGAAP